MTAPADAAQKRQAPGGIAVPATLAVLATPGFADYALVDSGGGRKLERFGRFEFDRPEPQALWQPHLDLTRWQRADAVFRSEKSEDDEGEAGRWRWAKPLPELWPVEVMGVSLQCRLTSFRHLGLFPEQLPHWQWMRDRLAVAKGVRPRVLNLFAYTGAASLIAAKAGAEVTHVDASKRAIAWGKANQAQSRLGEAQIRWILDDARKFVAREVRRGRAYDVILVDPPKFGRGPEGEVWDLFADLAPLLRDCARLVAPGPAAVVLTSYAIRASALAIGGLMRECFAGHDGAFETGELAIVETGTGRLLPTSLFCRWSRDA